MWCSYCLSSLEKTFILALDAETLLCLLVSRLSFVADLIYHFQTVKTRNNKRSRHLNSLNASDFVCGIKETRNVFVQIWPSVDYSILMA